MSSRVSLLSHEALHVSAAVVDLDALPLEQRRQELYAALVAVRPVVWAQVPCSEGLVVVVAPVPCCRLQVWSLVGLLVGVALCLQEACVQVE